MSSQTESTRDATPPNPVALINQARALLDQAREAYREDGDIEMANRLLFVIKTVCNLQDGL